jgi:hypothetical protein
LSGIATKAFDQHDPRLHEKLGIPADVLIRSSRLKRAA